MHEIGPRQPLPTTDRKRTHRVALTVAHRPPCPDHREGDDEQRSDSGSVDRGSTDRDDRPRAARTPSKEHECRMAPSHQFVVKPGITLKTWRVILTYNWLSMS